MALSNWDCVAFGPDGKPCNGQLNGPDGQNVEIYKNWLYIRDERMWCEGRSFVKPTIAQFNQGELTISGLEIVGKRGPQNSIFVYAEHLTYGEGKDLRMAGVGGYGFDDPTERILKAWGKPVPKYTDAMHGGSYGPDGHFATLILLDKDEDGKERIVQEINVPTSGFDDPIESKWVGITPQTLQEFFTWLKDVAGERDALDWFNLIDKDKATRFNQGDAFIAGNLGMDTPTTLPGKADDPILIKSLRRKGKKK